MIRALLVDDEDSANRWLTDLLRGFPTVEVVGAVTSVASAEKLLEQVAADVVFLDIEMPRRPGFDLFAGLAPEIRVVMVTAHDDRALRAYELGAVDYLLKPVTHHRLSITLNRLAALMAPPPPPLPAPTPSARVPIATPGGVAMVDLDAILWIEARENYSLIHRVEETPLLMKRTLNEWEQALPSRSFARIDRSTIINLVRVTLVQARQAEDRVLWFSGSSEGLPIGRAAATRLRRILAEQPT